MHEISASNTFCDTLYFKSSDNVPFDNLAHILLIRFGLRQVHTVNGHDQIGESIFAQRVNFPTILGSCSSNFASG